MKSVILFARKAAKISSENVIVSLAGMPRPYQNAEFSADNMWLRRCVVAVNNAAVTVAAGFDRTGRWM